jgi:light-regulated signal transduction histidine kinase (bacteriophytochrome)
MDNLAHDIRESRAQIVFEGLPKISGDKTLLIVLFQNLISNSIRFRRTEPLKISIDARPTQTEWTVSVVDNGQGFNTAEAERIFNLFEQLPEAKGSGHGIGLATCRKIIQTHGGRIWAESIPGEGARFNFTLPQFKN